MFSDNNKTLVLIVSLATLILMGSFILVVALMHGGKMDEEGLIQIKQDADDAFAAAEASADSKQAALYYEKARLLYRTLLNGIPKEDVKRRLDIQVKIGDVYARDQNQYTQALAAWQRAVTVDPNYAPAREKILGLHSARARSGRPSPILLDIIVDEASKLVKVAPNNVMGYLDLAFAKRSQRDLDGALEVLAVAKEKCKDAENPERIVYEEAICWLMKRERKKAENLLEELIKQRADLPEARVQYASIVMIGNRESMQRSLQILDDAEKKFPKNLEVLRALGRHYYRQASMEANKDTAQADLNKSVAYFRKVVEAAPEKAESYLQLGKQLSLRNKTRDEALKVYKAGLARLKPLHTYGAAEVNLYRNVKFRLLVSRAEGLVHGALRLKKPEETGKRNAMFDEVDSCLDDAGIIVFRHPRLSLIRGKVAFGRGRIKESIEKLEEAERGYQAQFTEELEAAKRNPFRIRDLLDAKTWLAQMYLYTGRYGNARLEVEFVLEYTPNSRKALALLLECDLRTYSHAAALKTADALLKIIPGDVRYLRAKASALRGLKRMTEAVDVLKAIPGETGSGGDRHARVEIAVILAQENRFADAEKILRDVVAGKPENVRAWFELYRALMAADKKDEAVKALGEAIAANPNNRRLKLVADMGKAGSQAEKEKIEEAFIKGETDAKRRYLQLARFYRRKHPAGLDKAVEQYRELERIDPNNRDAIQGIIDIAMFQKKWSLVDEYIQKDKKGNFDGCEGMLNKGRKLLVMGEKEQAVIALQGACGKQPRLSDANSALAEALRAVNRHEEAMITVNRALTLNPNNRIAWRVKILLLKDRGRLTEALAAIADAGRRAKDAWLVRQEMDILARTNPDVAIRKRVRIYDRFPKNLDNLLKLADLYVRTGKTVLAGEKFKEAYKQDPKNIHIVASLAYFHLRGGRYRNGLQLFNKFIDANLMPEKPYVPVIQIAKYQAVARQFADAKKNFLKAVEMAPQEQLPIRALADLYWQTKQYQQARGAYLKVKELSKGEDTDASKRLVRCYLNLNEISNAESEIGQYVLLNERDPEGYLLRALTILAKGRGDSLIDSALEQIDLALNRNPLYVDALYHRGRLLWLKKLITSALEALRQAKAVAPRNVQVRLLKANIHVSGKDTDEAITELEGVLQIVPSQHVAMVKLCRLYVMTGALDKLHALAERGVRLFPRQAIWPEHMGRFHHAKKNYASAEISFGQAVRLSNYHPDYVSLLLDVMGLAKRWQPLIDRAGKILVAIAGIKMPDVRRRRIQVICFLRSSNAYLLGMNDQKKSRELLLKAVDIAIESDEIRNWLYLRLFHSNRIEEVRELLRKAIEKDPKSHSSRFALAWMLFLGGKLEESQKYFEVVVANKPDDKRAWRLLALVYYKQQKDPEAKRAFQRAMKLDASDFGTLNDFAWFLAVRLKEYDAALNLAYRAAALQSDNANVLDTVGWIEHLAKKTDKAILTLRRGMKLKETEAIAYHLAVVHQSRNTDKDRVRAKQLAKKAIQLDPRGEKGEYGRLAKALIKSLDQ